MCFAERLEVANFQPVQRLTFQFNEAKSAQAVAFLLRRAKSNELSKGFLVKMLYVADCRQLTRVGAPITGDQPTAMENGPVLSHILNLFNGKAKSRFWSSFFTTADDRHLIHLIADPGADALSEAEKKSLSIAFDRYKNHSWPQLVEALHQRKEWIAAKPGKSSKPISFESIIEAEGLGPEFSNAIREDRAEAALLGRLFASAN